MQTRSEGLLLLDIYFWVEDCFLQQLLQPFVRPKDLTEVTVHIADASYWLDYVSKTFPDIDLAVRTLVTRRSE